MMQNSVIGSLSVIVTNIDIIVIFVAETKYYPQLSIVLDFILLSDISHLKLQRRYFIENQLVTFMLQITG
jgi:hypothetical protein